MQSFHVLVACNIRNSNCCNKITLAVDMTPIIDMTFVKYVRSNENNMQKYTASKVVLKNKRGWAM